MHESDFIPGVVDLLGLDIVEMGRAEAEARDPPRKKKKI